MSVNEAINPEGLATPAAAYSHAVLTRAGARMVHTSGVVPRRADGSVPDSLEEQARTVWANIDTMLQAAGMSLADIVAVTTYAVFGQDLSVVMRVRDGVLAGHRPASTLVTVPALVQPAWKVEISVVAAAD